MNSSFMKFREIALLLGVIVFLFVIGEVITRGVLYFDKENLESLNSYNNNIEGSNNELSLIDLIRLSRNNRIVYELKPNVSGVYINADVKINSKGLRDYEYSVAKLDNDFRIVGIGDSIMFGQGINIEDTFLKVLERKLNEDSSVKYEVINFAVPGYNAAMEVETLKQRALKYNPDLIILSSVSNDLALPNFVKSKSEISRMDKSYFYDFIVYRFRLVLKDELRPKLVTARLVGAPYKVDKDGNFYEYESELTRVPFEYRGLVGWDAVNKSFKELHDYASQNSIKVVVLLDYNDDEPMEEYSRTKNYTAYLENSGYNHEIEKLSEMYGFYWVDPVFSVSDYMNENNITSFSDLTISGEGHPNEMYHRAIGDQLFYFLSENNLI
ncbi:SGNH/GDSL hydrolase family protein [Candidatus Woesearchaeota archaeon]|nr:SGNH/GDSL hydrolase family protein [Candidatus Woesearchaeota archaeon]